MIRTKSLFRDSVKLLSGSLGIRIIGLVRGLIIPGLVTPTQYGLWRIVLLIWQYGFFLHLGTFAVMNRELPGLAALGRWGEHRRLRQTALWGSLVVAGMAALGLGIWSVTPQALANPEQAWALRISALGIVVQQLYTYHLCIFRTRSQFGIMSLSGFLNATLTLILTIALSYIWGVPGMAAGMMLATLIVTAGASNWSITDGPALRPREFGKLALTGIPLSGLPLTTTAMPTIGQVISALVLDLEQTGYYGIGIMFGAIVFAVPNAIGMALYPRYLEVFAVSRDSHEIGRMMRGALRVTALVAPLTVCTGIVAMEQVYRYLFPQYLPGLNATYVQLAMMAFIAYPVTVQNAVIALRKHWVLLGIQAAALGTGFLLGLIGSWISKDVTAIALGCLAANSVFGLVILGMTLNWTKENGQSVLREVLQLMTPTVVLGLLTVGLLEIDYGVHDSMAMDIAWTLVRVVTVLAIGGLLFVRWWKRAKEVTSESELVKINAING